MRVARLFIGWSILVSAGLSLVGGVGLVLHVLHRWLRYPELYRSNPLLPLLAAFVVQLVSSGALAALGRGVLRKDRWAHWGTGLVSLLMLPGFPGGTLLGLFGLFFAIAALNGAPEVDFRERMQVREVTEPVGPAPADPAPRPGPDPASALPPDHRARMRDARRVVFVLSLLFFNFGTLLDASVSGPFLIALTFWTVVSGILTFVCTAHLGGRRPPWRGALVSCLWVLLLVPICMALGLSMMPERPRDWGVLLAFLVLFGSVALPLLGYFYYVAMVVLATWYYRRRPGRDPRVPQRDEDHEPEIVILEPFGSEVPRRSAPPPQAPPTGPARVRGMSLVRRLLRLGVLGVLVSGVIYGVGWGVPAVWWRIRLDEPSRKAREGLKHSSTLDLAGNRLESVPSPVFDPVPIFKANFEGNQLKTVPEGLRRHPELVDLNLSINPLEELPPWIGELTGLVTLSLSRTRLKTFPASIGGLKSLQTLYLHSAPIESLPPQIGELKALQLLSMGRNNLTSLPPEIGKLSSLREVRIDDGELERLPVEIEGWSSLLRLHMTGGKLVELPPTVARLSKLETLQVSNNQISRLPPLRGMSSLNTIGLDSNHLEEIPDLRGLERLEQLSLVRNAVREIPASISSCKSLKAIDASHNLVVKIAPEVGLLTNLTSLNLSDNKISELPEEIGNLTRLYSLDLSGNPLERLPRGITRLTKLETLKLGETPLEELPLDTFRSMPSLKYLEINPMVLGIEWIREFIWSYPEVELTYDPQDPRTGDLRLIDQPSAPQEVPPPRAPAVVASSAPEGPVAPSPDAASPAAPSPAAPSPVASAPLWIAGNEPVPGARVVILPDPIVTAPERFGVSVWHLDLPALKPRLEDCAAGSLRFFTDATHVTDGSDGHRRGGAELSTVLAYCGERGIVPWLRFTGIELSEWEALARTLAVAMPPGAPEAAGRLSRIRIEKGNWIGPGGREPNPNLDFITTRAQLAVESLHAFRQYLVRVGYSEEEIQERFDIVMRIPLFEQGIGLKALMEKHPGATLVGRTLPLFVNEDHQHKQQRGGPLDPVRLQELLMAVPADRERRGRRQPELRDIPHVTLDVGFGDSWERSLGSASMFPIGRTLVAATAQLDAFLDRSLNGYRGQSAEAQRPQEMAHAPSSYPSNPTWLALGLRNRLGEGDMVPAVVLEGPSGGSDPISSYAFRHGDRYTVFVLSRRLKDATEVTLDLPFDAATRITRHLLSGDPGRVDPPLNRVQVVDILPSDSAVRRFSLPPASILVHVFEGTRGNGSTHSSAPRIGIFRPDLPETPVEPMRVRLLFPEPVPGLDPGSLAITGPADPRQVRVEPFPPVDGQTYDVILAGMRGAGDVTVGTVAGLRGVRGTVMPPVTVTGSNRWARPRDVLFEELAQQALGPPGPRLEYPPLLIRGAATGRESRSGYTEAFRHRFDTTSASIEPYRVKTGEDHHEIGRRGTSVWMSFLMRQDVASGEGWSVLTLHHGATHVMQPGYVRTYRVAAGLRTDRETSPGSARICLDDRVLPREVKLGQAVLFVLRLDFGLNGAAHLYVDPPIPAQSPPGPPDLSVPLLDFDFQCVSWELRGEGAFSTGEVRLGDSFSAVTPCDEKQGAR